MEDLITVGGRRVTVVSDYNHHSTTRHWREIIGNVVFPNFMMRVSWTIENGVARTDSYMGSGGHGSTFAAPEILLMLRYGAPVRYDDYAAQMSNGTPPMGMHDYTPTAPTKDELAEVDGNVKADEGTCHCFGNGTCFTCVAAVPVYTPIVIPAKCECGSDKANLPYHSSWCPKYDGKL